ncbi:MAG TPA: phosphoenolpyruvate--protein phosphotransferase [Chloroflexota bacterium]|nr:phosphoenolpyruvate--protein phosphotransferase [Chloroflexota bacterium]
MALRVITGVGASPGTGLGRAYLYRGPAVAPPRDSPGASPPIDAAELERLRGALAAAGAELEQMHGEAAARIGTAEAAVFEAQRLFLVDPSLVEPLEAAVRDRGLSAGAAVEQILEEGARDLEALDDPYLRGRAVDLRDVRRRLLRLLGAAGAESLSALSPGTILIAGDLTPSETVELRRENVLGLVLAGGTPTAHAAILARGLDLPLVLGAGPAVWQIQPGQPVLVDGEAGTVLVEPDAREQREYRRRLAARQQAHDGDSAADLPAQTLDGRRIELLANASSPAEARAALAHGAQGIGLLRSEFLLAALPSAVGAALDEDRLSAAYGEILQLMGERPVVVRAMDAGGDKPLPFLDVGPEANPALGWRGIRVLLDRPDLFIGQTHAVLRAAARHRSDLRLMFPMVSTLDEIIRARQLVETSCRAELSALDHPLQIGVMIEVPGAALTAEALAGAADFFSLGTNDLVQYTLACDRDNARVGHLAQIAHPAVLRLIDMVVKAAHAAGRKVGVCGEAAGEVTAIPLLVGLGVDELSVAPNRLPEVRRCIRQLSYRQAQQLAAEALTRATAEQVGALLDA